MIEHHNYDNYETFLRNIQITIYQFGKDSLTATHAPME